jgi:hypothetical protein
MFFPTVHSLLPAPMPSSFMHSGYSLSLLPSLSKGYVKFIFSSKDYRGAYNSQLNRLFKYLGIEKWRMNSSIDVATIVMPTPSSNPPGIKVVNNYGIAAGRSASISVVRPAVNGWPKLGEKTVQQQQRTMRSVSLRDG